MKIVAVALLSLFLLQLSAATGDQTQSAGVTKDQLKELNDAMDYVRTYLRTDDFHQEKLRSAVDSCERITGVKADGLVFTQGLWLPSHKQLGQDFRKWVKIKRTMEKEFFRNREKVHKEEVPRP